jgi:hypothetical protein
MAHGDPGFQLILITGPEPEDAIPDVTTGTLRDALDVAGTRSGFGLEAALDAIGDEHWGCPPGWEEHIQYMRDAACWRRCLVHMVSGEGAAMVIWDLLLYDIGETAP